MKYDQKNPDEVKFVICKYATDCLALLDNGLKVEEIIVGNQAPVQGTEYVMINGYVAATKEDAETYRRIAEYNGNKLICQIVPTRPAEDVLEELSKAGL